jgi:hypothetical protein
MTETLTINREIAERDGIDVDRLVTFYRQRNITVVEGGVKRTKTEKTCLRCDRMLPLEKFPRTAIHRLADGRTFPGQRSRECEDCYDAARAEAAEKTAASKVNYKGELRVKKEVERKRCLTCDLDKPVEQFTEPEGQNVLGYSVHCADCRGSLNKPPYGYKTCPGCEMRRHQEDFRTTRDGKRKHGRPFADCVACREESAKSDDRCTLCAGTGKRTRNGVVLDT